jgi:glycosyltransferase involved in cell wall biosynthesis
LWPPWGNHKGCPYNAGTKLVKRLIFLSLHDMRLNPFGELALPALSRRGWAIDVVGLRSKSSVTARVLPYPCRRHDIPALNEGRAAYEWRVFEWLQRARTGPYDVIYLHSSVVASRAALGLAGPLFGKRLVYHAHDFFDPLDHPVHAWLEKRLTRRAACYLNGEFHRAYVSQTLYGFRAPILIVPPHLPSAWPIPDPSPEIRRKLGANSPDDVLLMLHGGWSPLRTTRELLEAIALLPPRFRLVMTTDPGPPLPAEFARLGIEDRVVCIGRQNYEDLFQYTSSSDIGILLHANNDLGNFFQAPGRLTEYLASGIPVLASHFTGLQLLTLKHGVGLSADPGSPEDIAKRLLELEAGRRDGRFSRSVIRQRFLGVFAFDHWEDAVCQAFDEVMDSSPLPSRPIRPNLSTIGGPLYVPSRPKTSRGDHSAKAQRPSAREPAGLETKAGDL